MRPLEAEENSRRKRSINWQCLKTWASSLGQVRLSAAMLHPALRIGFLTFIKFGCDSETGFDDFLAKGPCAAFELNAT
jgi:hypothetical protein